MCEETEDGEVWCGWGMRHLLITEDDFKPQSESSPLADVNDVIDYNVPKHAPVYTVKHPPLPEVSCNMSS